MDGHLPVHEVDDHTRERVMSVNAGGTMRMLRAVIPQMLQAGAGAIVNVASLSCLWSRGCHHPLARHADRSHTSHSSPARPASTAASQPPNR